MHAPFLFLLLLLGSFYPLVGLQVSNLSTIENLRPGEKKRIQLTLINDKDYEESVDLKLADYGCNSDGEHFFDEPAGKAARSNAAWILLGQERVTLTAQEKRDLYFMIDVPSDDKLQGSYWSVLLIEPTDMMPNEKDEKEGLQLKIKIRFAHHIVANIGENAAPKLKVLKKEMKTIGTENYLCLHVLNQGDLFFNPDLTLSIYDEEGKLEKVLKAPPERLYPGNSQSYYLNLKDFTESRLQQPFKGFMLFDGQDHHLFGDRFNYP